MRGVNDVNGETTCCDPPELPVHVHVHVHMRVRKLAYDGNVGGFIGCIGVVLGNR